MTMTTIDDATLRALENTETILQDLGELPTIRIQPSKNNHQTTPATPSDFFARNAQTIAGISLVSNLLLVCVIGWLVLQSS